MPSNVKPTSLSSVPGTEDLARLQLAKPDGSADVFIIKTDVSGNVASSRVIKSQDKSVSVVTGCKNTDDLLQLRQKCIDDQCHKFESQVQVNKLRTFDKIVHSVEFDFGFEVDQIQDAWGTCDDDDSETKQAIYQVVVSTKDGVMTSVTPLGNMMWNRDESLATVVKAELVSPGDREDNEDDLGAPEVGQGEAKDVMALFVKRFKRHFVQFSNFVVKFMEIKDLVSYNHHFIHSLLIQVLSFI